MDMFMAVIISLVSMSGCDMSVLLLDNGHAHGCDNIACVHVWVWHAWSPTDRSKMLMAVIKSLVGMAEGDMAEGDMADFLQK
jgi:hypothetical protein